MLCAYPAVDLSIQNVDRSQWFKQRSSPYFILRKQPRLIGAPNKETYNTYIAPLHKDFNWVRGYIAIQFSADYSELIPELLF
jgi:hypothetical protein